MNRGFLFGAAVAAGTLVLIPGVALAMSRAGRPLVRAAVKSGAVAYKEFQKAGAEVYEQMEDLAAEFRAEMDSEEAAEADAAAEMPASADAGRADA